MEAFLGVQRYILLTWTSWTCSGRFFETYILPLLLIFYYMILMQGAPSPYQQIVVPPIHNNAGKLVKDARTYDVKKRVTANHVNIPSRFWWIEVEFFTMNEQWEYMVYTQDGYVPISQLTWEPLPRIERFPDAWDERLTSLLRSQNAPDAQITTELWCGTQELAFSRGYEYPAFYRKTFEAIAALFHVLGNNNVYPIYQWTTIVPTQNINNFSNPYYEYLIKERDSNYWLSEFRWTGTQLHAEMDSYGMSLYVYNRLRSFLPYFLFLGSNSPIHNGAYNGNLSERIAQKIHIFQDKTWIPPEISFTFLEELQWRIDSGVKSVTPYYRFLRYPRVCIKTLENCMPDSVDDLPTLLAMCDLYFRIIQKLKQDYIEWSDSLQETWLLQPSSAWMNASIESVLRKGNKGVIHDMPIQVFTEKLLDRLEDIPTTLDANMLRSLWYKDTDFLAAHLGFALANWNLAQQTLKELWITRSWNIQWNEASARAVQNSIRFGQEVSRILSAV